MTVSPLMWWYDGGDLPDSVKKAAARFKEKNGYAANTVWFNSRENPSEETLDWLEKRGIVVKTGKYVLNQHFRVGRERIERGAKGESHSEEEKEE